MDFIQLHYFTQREDTEFWRWCKHDIKKTEFNNANIENFKTHFINQVVLPEDGMMSLFRIYDCLNWAQVMHGLRMFDTAKIKELYDVQYGPRYRAWCENNYKQMHGVSKDGWVKHKEAIDLVKHQLKITEYTL
jgi:hypothetical protein